MPVGAGFSITDRRARIVRSFAASSAVLYGRQRCGRWSLKNWFSFLFFVLFLFVFFGMACGKYLGIRLFTVIDISNNGQSACPNITVLQRAMSYMYNIYVCILHAQNGFFFCSLNFVLYLCVARGHLNRPIWRAGGSAGNFRFFFFIYLYQDTLRFLPVTFTRAAGVPRVGDRFYRICRFGDCFNSSTRCMLCFYFWRLPFCRRFSFWFKLLEKELNGIKIVKHFAKTLSRSSFSVASSKQTISHTNHQ